MIPAPDHMVHLGVQLFYGGLRSLGATAARRRLQDAGLILCYHNVVSGADQVGDPALHVPRDRFERQMRWLADHYNVLSLRAFTNRLAQGDSLRSAAVITFDDAYAGVFEHALPLLDRLRLPATIFVVAEAPGRSTGFWWDQPSVVNARTPARYEQWLTTLQGDGDAILAGVGSVMRMPEAYRPADWATLRAHAGRRIDYGAHSVTHRALPTLTNAEIQREVVTSRLLLYRATDVWPEFFAYPYGLCDHRTRAIVRSAGYRAALSLGGDLNVAPVDLWGLKRVNVPAGISHAAFEAWAAGFHPRRKQA